MKVQPPTEPVVEEARTSGVLRTLLVVALVAAAGLKLGLSAVIVIVALVLMIFMHELGHYLTARSAGMKVTEFFIGFGPRLWSFHRGETEYGLKAIPAGAYVRIIGMSNLEEVDPSDEDRTYRAKPYWRRLSVAVAGSTMHFLMALALAFIVFAGVGVRDPETHAWTIGSLVEPSAATRAGLVLGDRIVAVDGRNFGTFDEVSDYLRANPGEEVTLRIDHDGSILERAVTLASENPNTGEHVGFLGVGPTFPAERVGPVDAAWRSAREFGTVAKMSVVGLGHILSPSGVSNYVDTILSPETGGDAGEIPEDRPTSVVGIVQIGSQVSEDGWVNVLYLLFGVNIFIGVFNLLPVLPFDGGHVAVATYEKIRSMISGRRYQADVAKLLPLTYVVVMALALLFVTTIYLDIARPISIR